MQGDGADALHTAAVRIKSQKGFENMRVMFW